MTPDPAEYTQGLRALADFLDAHPDLTPLSGLQPMLCCLDGPDFDARGAEVASGAPPESLSGRDDTHLGIHRQFGPHLYQLIIPKVWLERPVTDQEVELATVEPF